MKKITRDKTVPINMRYRVHKPVIEIDLGESLLVETVNSRTPVIRTAEDANTKSYREREETGPIYVNGIKQGDVLAIRIKDIEPESHAS